MHKRYNWAAISIFIISPSTWALKFELNPNSDLVGEVQSYVVEKNETFGEIGRRFDIGMYEMIEANPTINPWIPELGAVLTIPSQFVLPPGKREGIVLNQAELRLYYYDSKHQSVYTYPVGIGLKKWPTPIGKTKIIVKTKDPTWTPTPSIRAEHALAGEILPPNVPPGKDNPLGDYALRLGFPNILMHGTNQPGGIGLRGSHGCLRFMPQDVKELFSLVKVGTPVEIIHAPFKVGLKEGELYIEAHQALNEERFNGSDNINLLIKKIEQKNKAGLNLDWKKAGQIAKRCSGMPEKVDLAQ